MHISFKHVQPEIAVFVGMDRACCIRIWLIHTNAYAACLIDYILLMHDLNDVCCLPFHKQVRNPSMRCTIKQLLEHPFIQRQCLLQVNTVDGRSGTFCIVVVHTCLADLQNSKYTPYVLSLPCQVLYVNQTYFYTYCTSIKHILYILSVN